MISQTFLALTQLVRNISTEWSILLILHMYKYKVGSTHRQHLRISQLIGSLFRCSLTGQNHQNHEIKISSLSVYMNGQWSWDGWENIDLTISQFSVIPNPLLDAQL